MKIIQINVWGGHLLQPLSKFIASEQADIVCVQEIVHTKTTSSLFDYFDALNTIKTAGQYEHVFFSPTFSFIALGEEVEFGNAIFSRLPLTNQQTVFINGSYAKNQSMSNLDANVRNLQLCTITINSKTINLANHHGFHDLNPNGTEMGKQNMNRVAQILKPHAESLLFCGDLNVIPSSETLKELDVLGLNNQTTISDLDTTLSSVHGAHPEKVVCDYILTSKDIVVQKFASSETIVSDHKALILDFQV